MLKLIIFDLDGVLVDAKMIHFNALNDALIDVGCLPISLNEHLRIYDGLKTNEKLRLLTNNNCLPIHLQSTVWRKKQEFTQLQLQKINESPSLISLVSRLKEMGYNIACCSNSIRETVEIVLSKTGIIKYFELILSNEDVKNSKPHPEIYWKAVSNFGVLPEETLILEDSPVGLLGAARSGCHVMRVDCPRTLDFNNILNKINSIKNMKTNVKWKNEKLNVVIPMAGAGSRFEKAGYTFPKPLIDVEGKPMIQLIVENLNIDANFIFIVKKEHREKYNLDTLLNLISPGCSIVETDFLTEGAACTTLLSKTIIDNDNPLLLVNSDQYIEWNSVNFMYKMSESKVDAGILTFRSTHPKWSYAKTNDEGFVTEVAEKNPISDTATVGIYYWKKGSDYVKYAEQMIRNNTRVNNEFYVCPVFNEAIRDGAKVTTFDVFSMWGLGTPEDLKVFLDR